MKTTATGKLANGARLPCVKSRQRRPVAAQVIRFLAACLVGFAPIANATGGPEDAQDFGVQTLSAAPDLVSGGDVLVQITFKHDNKNHPLVIKIMSLARSARGNETARYADL